MKRILSLLLPLPALAQAACLTVDFPGPTGSPSWSPVGTVNGTGISLTFGDGWVRVADSDYTAPPDWVAGEPWGAAVGSFANEPSANGAGTFFDYGVKAPNIEISVSTPARYVEFWYTGNAHNCLVTGNGPCNDLGGTLPLQVDARNAQYQWQGPYFTPSGETGVDSECWDAAGACSTYHAQGAGGSGDPTGHFRVWRKATFTFAQPFVAFRVQAIGVWMRWYIDDLRVCTVPPPPTCPDPPCEFE